jgi:hypothetical protein
MATERLVQYNTFQDNHLGFKGILSGVADEIIPDGYVPDMENLRISVEGIAESVIKPAKIVPPTGQTALKSMFVWQKDDGTNTLLAQFGTKLYRWKGTFTGDGSDWLEIKNGTSDAFSSANPASFAGGMMNECYIAQENTQLMKLTSSFVLSTLPNGPKARYITIWKNRIFLAYITTSYGMSSTSGTNGTANTTLRPAGVYWSNVNLMEVLHDTDSSHYDNGFPELQLNLTTPENSEATGMLPVKENLVLFCKSAIFTFSGYSNNTFSLFDYYHGANTPKNNALVVAGGAYYVSEDGYFTLAQEPKPISLPVVQLIHPESSLVSCAYFDSRIWFCTGHSLTAMNINNGNWERYEYGTHNVETQDIVYSADHLYLGMSSGAIYILDVNDSTGSGYMNWYLQTPVHNQGLTSADKRYKTLFVFMKNSSAPTKISYSLDYSSERNIIPDIVGADDGDKWGTMLWGTGTWSETSQNMETYKRFVISDVARTIKLRFSGSGKASLLGYSIVFTPKRKMGVR